MSVHLVVLVHGLLGTQHQMYPLKEVLDAQDRFKVYVIASIGRTRTFDGIGTCAWRAYHELIGQLQQVGKLSIIGYSLGGLISRYLVGILEETKFWDVSGIESGFFATFASPLLGVTLSDPSFKDMLVNWSVFLFLGPTGRELVSEDKHGVLAGLADPQGPAYIGLKKFELFLVANIINDIAVPFWTSFLTDTETIESPYGLTVIDDNPDESFTVNLLPETSEKNSEKDLHKSHLKLSLWPLHITFDRTPAGRIELCMSLIPAVPIALILEFVTLVAAVSLTVKGSFIKVLGNSVLGRRQRKHDINELATMFSTSKNTVAGICSPAEAAAKSKQPSSTATLNVISQHLPNTQRSAVSWKDKAPLSQNKKSQLDALNSLPWKKYAVRFEQTKSAHQEIIDISRNNAEGKALIDYMCTLFPS